MNTTTDSVRLALFDTNDSTFFLVLAETDDPTNWKLPGGKFNSVDETPDDANERELDEELGIKGLMASVRQAGKLTNNDGVSARYIYAGTVQRDQIRPSAEIESVQWVSLETIPDGPNKEHILTAVQLARTAL